MMKIIVVSELLKYIILKIDGLRDIVEELHKKGRCISSAKYNVYTKKEE